MDGLCTFFFFFKYPKTRRVPIVDSQCSGLTFFFFFLISAGFYGLQTFVQQLKAETSGYFFISSFFTVLKEPLASTARHYVY